MNADRSDSERGRVLGSLSEGFIFWEYMYDISPKAKK